MKQRRQRHGDRGDLAFRNQAYAVHVYSLLAVVVPRYGMAVSWEGVDNA